MRTDRGFERLLFFSDAVVAIALTLLVLPLVDLAKEAHGRTSTSSFLGDHLYALFAFALGFVVIGVLWRAHHELFEHLRSYDSTVLAINELWLFTIVLLPFATELINRSHTGRTANGLYVATLLVSSLCLTGIKLIARRRPGLRHPDSAADPTNPIDEPPGVTAGVLAVILVVVIAVPSGGLWPMVGLMLASPIRAILVRRRGSSPTS